MTARCSTCRFLFLGLVLAASSARLPAQKDPCLTRTVAVNVMKEDGNPVLGLTAANFRGKYRGKAVEIVSVKYDTGPRRVVILLDASGSMQDLWRAEIIAAQNLVWQAPMKDLFAALSFAEGTTYKRIGFGIDQKSMVGALGRLGTVANVEAKTAVRDAMLEALNMLGTLRIGDALFLVSDGGDNASESDRRQANSVLLSSGVRLFALVMQESLSARGRTPEEVDGPHDLHNLVVDFGGDDLSFASAETFSPLRSFDKVVTERDRKRLAFAVRALGREISEFYALEVKMPEAIDKPRGWQLEVVENDPKNQHLRVVYPHRLAPCQ